MLGLLAIPNGGRGNAYGGALCASVIGGPDGDQPIATLMGGVDDADTKEAIRTTLLDCERRRGSRLVWALAVAGLGQDVGGNSAADLGDAHAQSGSDGSVDRLRRDTDALWSRTLARVAGMTTRCRA